MMRKIFIPLLSFIFIFSLALPARAQPSSVLAYYAGADGSVRTALDLADAFTFVSDVDQAQVFILNGEIPIPDQIAARVQKGAGLLLIMGSALTANQVEQLLGTPVTLSEREDPVSLTLAAQVDDEAIRKISWESSPQIRKRRLLESPALNPLITGYESHEIILGETALGQGRIYTFSGYLDGANQQIRDWAYFNYMIYALALKAAGAVPLSFGSYPASPVPHTQERVILYLLLAAMLLTMVTAFILIRRYSLAHPELLDVLVGNREEFKTREKGTDWEEIGFHRPLGGFMMALTIGLILFIPLIIYQNLILPVYILPSAQALGIWERVKQFFNLFWTFFDVGTSAAFIKFFAEYRVHDPRRAIQYGQVFVWWQALSGAVQVALLATIAGSVLPDTAYAIYAWSVIIHTFIQIPGFYQVMKNALTALQRFDYAQILDLALNLVFPMLAQPVFVLIMVAWGNHNPAFGPSMGGLLGLGIAAYASEAFTFLVGLFLYKRIGYNARLLFLAHFDWGIIKKAFRFGIFEMLGSIVVAIGQAMEVVITQMRLINYTEIWGNWGLAQNFIFSFNVVGTLYNNLMPSISESISHARLKLSQYYTVMAYKYGGMLSAFIGAVLLAIGDRFILGASGPDFMRASYYIIPLAIWGAVQYPSWVGDNVQRAANKPVLIVFMVTLEQTIRISLAFALISWLQINALIIAYFVGLFTKDIVSYFINNRFCYKQRFYVWQSLAAPLLAGGTHYLLLRWLTGYIWKGDQVTSILIFFLGILISFPIFTFLYAFFGGWDNGTLEELKQGAALTSFMRWFSRLIYLTSAWGARLSPLHNRFPITLRSAALAEAKTLTAERVELA